jgi:hypothetical protein
MAAENMGSARRAQNTCCCGRIPSIFHSNGLIPARLLSSIVWLDCACQGCPKIKRGASRGVFCLWLHLEQCSPSRGPGWLGRRVGIFQPEFSAIPKNASCSKTAMHFDLQPMARQLSYQKYELRRGLKQDLWLTTVSAGYVTLRLSNMPFIQFPFIEVPKGIAADCRRADARHPRLSA